MKRLLVLGVMLFAVAMSSVVVADDVEAGKAELKSLGRELLKEKMAASKQRGRIRRVNLDDQTLNELDARKNELEKAIDNRLRELNKEYDEMAKKIEAMEKRYMDMKEKLLAEIKAKTGDNSAE